MNTYIVTSAPPNPNGDLHLGHLSGPFLGADVLSRHLRQRGHEVRYVGYSDEHSCYVPRRAAEIGSTPHETALLFGNRMEETLSLGSMHHDWFTRPLMTPKHTEIVQSFFTRLWEAGKLKVVELPVFHCPRCERYLYEAEVRGECQFCAAPSDGIYCEACGLAQESGALGAAKCTACWETPELTTLQRIVFPLEEYREQLLAYYAKNGGQWRPRLRAYLDTLFENELPLTPISRQADYGIPVPLDGWEGHILDTWFSGICGYLAGTACLTEAQGQPGLWQEQWSDPDTRIVNFLGFDCSFSHAVLWPALLLAHGDYTLPSQVITNEFYRLEGDKFSTSRGHAIWGGEFLHQVNADALRFHLCLTGPEREQGNFAMKELVNSVETILVDGLQRWAQTVFSLLAEDFGSTVPEHDGLTEPLTISLLELPKAIAVSLSANSFSPQRAAGELAATIDRAVKDLPRLNEARGAAGGSEEGQRAYASRLVTHVETLALVSVLAAPLMPGWAHLIAKHLDIPVDVATRMPSWPELADLLLVPAGRQVKTPLPDVFHKLG